MSVSSFFASRAIRWRRESRSARCAPDRRSTGQPSPLLLSLNGSNYEHVDSRPQTVQTDILIAKLQSIARPASDSTIRLSTKEYKM